MTEGQNTIKKHNQKDISIASAKWTRAYIKQTTILGYYTYQI